MDKDSPSQLSTFIYNPFSIFFSSPVKTQITNHTRSNTRTTAWEGSQSVADPTPHTWASRCRVSARPGLILICQIFANISVQDERFAPLWFGLPVVCPRLCYIQPSGSLYERPEFPPRPLSFTEYKAELDGLLFDVRVGLGDVRAATAEGVCQNRGHFDAVIHEGLETVVQEVPAQRKTSGSLMRRDAEGRHAMVNILLKWLLHTHFAFLVTTRHNHIKIRPWLHLPKLNDILPVRSTNTSPYHGVLSGTLLNSSTLQWQDSNLHKCGAHRTFDVFELAKRVIIDYWTCLTLLCALTFCPTPAAL